MRTEGVIASHPRAGELPATPAPGSLRPQDLSPPAIPLPLQHHKGSLGVSIYCPTGKEAKGAEAPAPHGTGGAAQASILCSCQWARGRTRPFRPGPPLVQVPAGVRLALGWVPRVRPQARSRTINSSAKELRARASDAGSAGSWRTGSARRRTSSIFHQRKQRAEGVRGAEGLAQTASADATCGAS